MLSQKVLSATAMGVDPIYVDDVFQTWLYAGNGTSQTINNGIDLAGKGGMVWTKVRNTVGYNHGLVDTARGRSKSLASNVTDAERTSTATEDITSFNSNGFSVGVPGWFGTNASGEFLASWTFRKAPKFFDVVTYTGTGANRTIAHNLGSNPGCIIVKRTDTTSNWQVYHRGLTSAANSIQLNLTNAQAAAATVWNSTAPTSTVFSVGTSADVNASGGSYVAYLFAHDAGGFGASGTDNVISCGTFTTNTVNVGNVTLGWEPQWVMVKQSGGAGNGDWNIYDNMRGFTTAAGRRLEANTSDAEANAGGNTINSTGFSILQNPSASYIYIAIRRPMKPPTSGTSVFSPVAYTGTGSNNTVAAGFATDMVIEGNRTSASAGQKFGAWDRMRSVNFLNTTTTAAEVAATTSTIQANPWDSMTGIKVAGTSALTNASGVTFAYWMFKRAPGFFDEVCYTGNGTTLSVTHGLGVVPQLIIVKSRSNALNWYVYQENEGSGNALILNSTSASSASAAWNSTSPTNTAFTVSSTNVNTNNATYVAYLFATLPGISKVGRYTGNGSSQTIDCGFAAGARFFLVKATSTTGSWWVYDSARGIVAAADPALQLNSTAAEVTSADAVDPTATGIIVNQEATCSINASGVSYIFLAIA